WPLQDPAFGIGPLLDAESQLSAHERRNPIKEEVIQKRPRLPSNLNDILKSRRCNQRDASAFSLQQRVGPDSGAVQQRDSSSGASLSLRSAGLSFTFAHRRYSFANLPQSFGNRTRRIIGRRKYLQSFESATLHPHAIGERTSGVDCDTQHGMRRASHGLER